MSLGRFKRDLQGFRLFQRHHLRHHGLCGASTLAGQAAEQLGKQTLCLCSVDSTHHADLGLAQQQVARHKLRHGGGVNASQTGFIDLRAVRMLAKNGLVKGLASLRGRLGIGFTDRSHPTLTLALPHIVRETGGGQLPCRQSHGCVKQLGAGQAAQRKAHAVVPSVGVDHGAQIRPCFTQLVFIHGRLALKGLDALAHHAGSCHSQAALARGITAIACIKFKLHIHHGNAGCFHQIHLGSCRHRPVLNRDTCP